MTIKDILFIIFAAVILYLLIREFIPDHIKKYWRYIRQDAKDHRAGRKRRWVWTFKR